MDLCTDACDWAYYYLRDHCDEQPRENNDLTWYVSAAFLYGHYAGATYRAKADALSFNELWVALRIMFPRIGAKKHEGKGIYTGIRFSPSGIKENFEFGV